MTKPDPTTWNTHPETSGDGLPGRRRAQDITRGVERLARDMGLASLTEFVLASGRRADVTALGKDGSILMVEIKSGVPDFRADTKWQDYLDFCDTFYFAVAPDFPLDILPKNCGIMVADRYGAQVLRPDPLEGPETKLGPARRKAVTLRFARAAATRLAAGSDITPNAEHPRL